MSLLHRSSNTNPMAANAPYFLQLLLSPAEVDHTYLGQDWPHFANTAHDQSVR